MLGFRPSGAPQDLVMVEQSRVLQHLSLAVGGYLSYSLDPLVLQQVATGKASFDLIKNQLELDVMAAVGLFNWLDVSVAVPVILYQDGDNMQAVGTEGTVQSTSLADIRLNAKVAIPGLRRPAEGKGFGMALNLGISIPTGSPAAFTGDGTVDYMAGLILDYRFGSGLLLALNGGVWIRPQREFAGLVLGDSTPLGAAIELPIIRKWGLAVLGEVFGNVSLSKLVNEPRQVPIEALFGVRWYADSGFTLTVGAGGGCTCAFGAPAFSFFVNLIWVPKRTHEYEALQRFKHPPEQERDPDKDGVIGPTDRCPDKPGPVENQGCPDEDRDSDTIVDRLDKCPDDYASPGRGDGCPMARIQGDKIVIMEQVHFATDQDIILPESYPILEEVGKVMEAHPELEQVLVEGHTDIRASAAYNRDLSDRRARSVMNFLVEHGVEPGRLHSQGFGRERPVAPNNTEAGMALNRRVEFTIEKRGASPSVRAVTGQTKPAEKAGLPNIDAVLPNRSLLPNYKLPAPVEQPVLPAKDAVLPSGAPSQNAAGGAALPGAKSILPTTRTYTPRSKKDPSRIKKKLAPADKAKRISD